MAIKKSELYSSIWASCDALRGGMDASQYKDYVLTLLFIKYVSDKYEGSPYGALVVPEDGSFKAMTALKGKAEIGDKMNKIFASLTTANGLDELKNLADFNDTDKLGQGKEMIDRLTKLITIFENPALNFSKNKAGGDDLLGDAYEYLMRHFATQSGKSKGQFYTPSEVSRIVAKVLDIQNTTNNTTFYDPTCGSGSLLLKALDEADGKGSIYGQEKDVSTAALARMNMILHDDTSAVIARGQSTLSDPNFKDENGYLRTFDFVVANPPFSLKDWSTGFNPQKDLFSRFDGIGIPPDKNGDYAFLIHIIKSLNSTGKAACILPHGVLFRGNAEAVIRQNLIDKGYIKGIIGLPANLFYGTGIPACIIVIDKEHANGRTHIFMLDASKGFIKDGNKNQLREQDIHNVVDVFNKQLEVPKYSRLVAIEEIKDPKNDYNLNLPRYIDNQDEEDIQDIEAHLLGGIPNIDIESLEKYWTVYPSLKNDLFEATDRPNYSQLRIAKEDIKTAIFNHAEFVSFSEEMENLFLEWKTRITQQLKNLEIGFKPKELIHTISEDLLQHYTNKPLLDKYDIYQHLMSYWNETMQDDAYLIALEGWQANVEPIYKEIKKKGKETTKKVIGHDCDILPKTLVIERFFKTEKETLQDLEAQRETALSEITELEEEHNTEDGLFYDYDKISKKNVETHLKKLNKLDSKEQDKEEIVILENYLKLQGKVSKLNAQIKTKEASLDGKALLKYPELTEQDIKQLIVEDKWIGVLEKNIKSEMERISQRLTQRIRELAERYQSTLPELQAKQQEMESKVIAHLQTMGF
ncbi:type I restriction-modification system subunit M [Bernardetia sp. OM2101]|uniref:type I restriction-modification system subunit M n=1 Tax=Bernardetia sp. OM2101 TaxID=3344876 RepID=UPI0035CEA47D